MTDPKHTPPISGDWEEIGLIFDEQYPQGMSGMIPEFRSYLRSFFINTVRSAVEGQIKKDAEIAEEYYKHFKEDLVQFGTNISIAILQQLKGEL